jgi:phosphatidylglycerophosphatase A
MNIGGWIMLIVTWGIILGLSGFCFYRVFSKKKLD